MSLAHLNAELRDSRAVVPAAAARTILEVKDLVTHFPVRNGVVKAVDGVSFTLERGKTLCIVGESGSGKSVTARSILQIVDAPGRIVSGSMILHRGDGTSVDLAKLDPRGKAIRAIRGREIAMIFQEPMSSLSPVHTRRRPDHGSAADPFEAGQAGGPRPLRRRCCSRWKFPTRRPPSTATRSSFPAACASAS